MRGQVTGQELLASFIEERPVGWLPTGDVVAAAFTPQERDLIVKALRAYQSPLPEATDSVRLDWLERENPIVFHKTGPVDDWELVVGVRHDNDGVSFVGKTLREATDKAIAASTPQRRSSGDNNVG